MSVELTSWKSWGCCGEGDGLGLSLRNLLVELFGWGPEPGVYFRFMPQREVREVLVLANSVTTASTWLLGKRLSPQIEL